MIAQQPWRFIARHQAAGEAVGLMVVVDSQGSSPGRRGFKMAVAADGSMVGSIGGGIMEHKLVEFVRDRLAKGLPIWELRRQIHSKDATTDQSGMICSGEQTVAIMGLSPIHLTTIQSILDGLAVGKHIQLSLDNKSLSCTTTDVEVIDEFQSISPDAWRYHEMLAKRDIAHVVGAGHVGLAMCKILASLDFEVVNYDDRPDLNTMQANQFADRKIVTAYSDLATHIQPGNNVYVIIMTFGYRGDDEAIRALLGMHFRYLGMMGSEAKIQKMRADLVRDGFTQDQLAPLKAPAGLIPHCKTPTEIALSIAAEIIATRNAR